MGPLGGTFPVPWVPFVFPTLDCLLWEGAQKVENKQQLDSAGQSTATAWALLQAGSEGLPLDASTGFCILLSSGAMTLHHPMGVIVRWGSL